MALMLPLAVVPPAAAQDAAGEATPVEAADQQSEAPVSANELKAAIDAIKQRLAKQQEGRQTTGTGELAAELKAARETIADLTQSMNRLRSERDGMLAELKALNADVTRRSATIGELEREMEQLRSTTTAQMSDLQRALAERSTERDQFEARSAELDQRLESALAETADLTETIERARADRDTVEQALKAARTEANSKLADRDTALGDAQERLAALESDIAERSAERDALSSQAAELRTQLAAVSAAAEKAARESDGLSEQLASLRADLESKSGELEQARVQMAELREEKRQVEQEAEGRLRERTRALSASLQAAEGRVAELEGEMTGLREVASTSVVEVENLGTQLYDALKENEEMLAALADVRASKVILDDELEAARKDVQLYATQASTLREQIGRMQAMAGDAAQDAGEGAGDESAEMAQLRASFETAQKEIDKLTEELILREQKIAQGAVEGDVGALNQRIADLERELRQRDEENAATPVADAGDAGAGDAGAGEAGAAASAPAEADVAQGGAGEAGTSDDAVSPSAGPRSGEVQVASIEPIEQIDAFLDEMNAIETADGWLMTVPEGIVFAPGSDELAPEAAPALSKVASLLQHFQDRDIRIVGHTDSFGDAQVNRELSLRRAESVRDYLRDAYGLTQADIATEGLGEDRPIASNDTISGRRANRRVEIYVRR
ncbi:MAG: OmpA family protein [Geminicoccaceae bacterium]|nr:OmpA family protein [Geminicoccaceae bacterium]